MDGYSIFVMLLAGYVMLLIGTGYYFNKRQTSIREFLLAGKRVGALSIGFSAAASWLTAGAILAVIGFFMLLGMGSIWGFVAPNIIALLVIALLVKKIQSIPAMTQPELLEIRYGSFLRTPVALIIIVVMILFAVADIKGFALVLQVFYGISSLQAALIVGLSVAVYVTLGGLSAVLATDVIQFLCLSFFVLVMTILVLSGAGDISGMDLGQMVGSMDGSWWNPMSIGWPMVLIFCFAIIPGWITEQDPWQKIWAAKDEKSAKIGLVIGSVLVALVFAGCALIALGLQFIYPEIAKMGFPMGMAKAEPALLTFIMERGYSDLVVALFAVALATAAMSCADTFAASGASCVARDLYQRRINPSASMHQMLTVNRLSVLFIIGCATIGSFFIKSIIDAIHIATFIASASYFFVLMGGLFWRRGTGVGASASMFTGFILQCTLVGVDLAKTTAGGPPFLESLSPFMMGHGVIVAMGASGFVYVLVSLATKPSEVYRLAPFFVDKAKELVAIHGNSGSPQLLPAAKEVFSTIKGSQVHLQMDVDLPSNLSWQEFILLMNRTHPHWISLGGLDSTRRCTRPEILSCVSLIRGQTSSNAWLEIEGAMVTVEELQEEVSRAYHEIVDTLKRSTDTRLKQTV
ncbi:MAG: SSS family solute:Na+ symporter [Desulforhopalus sp.]|jgi:SSS family solute:Na+ symporter